MKRIRVKKSTNYTTINNEFIFNTSNVIFEQSDRLVCLVNKKDIKQIEELFE